MNFEKQIKKAAKRAGVDNKVTLEKSVVRKPYTYVCVICHKTGDYGHGFSKCNPGCDDYDVERGLNIAVSRAVHDLQRQESGIEQ